MFSSRARFSYHLIMQEQMLLQHSSTSGMATSCSGQDFSLA